MSLAELGLTFGERTLVLGVLNVTPDSFSDGGRFLEPDAAVARAHQMVAAGADAVDVGGQSSRPGSEPVSEQEELRRVQPVVEALVAELPVPVSIDTYRCGVARMALAAGARFVNDISALRFDEGMGRSVAAHGAGLILMHMQGMPLSMQDSPRYDDVVAEVRAALSAAMERAVSSGVERGHLLVDPGFGFGKTAEHNLQLLGDLGAFRTLGCPVVVGLSRKSTLGALTGVEEPEARMPASIAAAALAALRGADMVRVHDVAATRQALALADALSKVTKSR